MLAAFVALAATCVSTPPTPEGLRAAEAQWTAALEHREAAALACLLDPSFSDNDWRGGVRTRADLLAALPSRPPGEIVLRDLDVRMERDVGIVRGVSATRDPAGKLVRPARFTDVFVRRDGRWVAIAAQETPVLD